MKKYIILTFAISLLLFVSPSFSRDMKLHISGSEEKIDSYNENNITYFSFSEFVEIFGGTLDWETIGHKIVFKEDTLRFEFLIGSSYFKRGESMFNMTYPGELVDGKLYLPAKTFLPFFDEVFFQEINFNSKSKSIRVISDYFNVNDINFSVKANGMLVEIFLTGKMAYDVFVTEGNWVNISIRGARLNRPMIESRKNSRYMYQLKTHQQNQNGQVSFRLKRKVEKWKHKFVNDPPRIQISISDVDFELEPSDSAPKIGPDNKIDVIVIDAGHGGDHYGAVGPKKTREKDVALDIARELAKLIRKDKQFKVVMTRDRDKTVSLEDRAKIANKNTCDLFISVHANSSLKKHVRGWNVFFLAQAKNDSARSVAQMENSSFLRDRSEEIGYAEPGSFNDPILGILNEMIMTEFQVESHDFALMVDKEFRKSLKTPARGVDQAGFFVLNRVYSPSVLLEVGFISNKKEEKIIKDRKYQKKVAKAVYNAIKRFKAKYESM